MAAIIIVGARMAAYTLARELRKLDRTTPPLLVTSDADWQADTNRFEAGGSHRQGVQL